MNTPSRLSLGEALAGGRLSEFIDQAEVMGIGPADPALFDAIVRRYYVLR